MTDNKDNVEHNEKPTYVIDDTKNSPLKKATTVVLSEENYNFLKGAQYYENTTLEKRITMSDVLNDAIDAFKKEYQEKYDVIINKRGKVIESK